MFADTNGVVLNTAYIILVLAGAGGVIAFLFKMLISSKDREYALLLEQKEEQLKELIGAKKSLEEIAAEAVKSAVDATNFYRQKDGKPPLLLLAPVVTESHSPSTEKQRATAQVATWRAAMAVVKLATGQEPRQEPDRERERE